MNRTADSTHSASRLAEALRQWAEHRPELVAVYLFGSWTEGQVRTGSDVDVGLLVAPAALKAIRGEHRLGFEVRVSQELTNLLDEPVDVVVLNEAPPALAWRAVFRGRLAFSRDERARIAHATEVQQAYLRAAPLRALRREYLRRRFGGATP